MIGQTVDWDNRRQRHARGAAIFVEVRAPVMKDLMPLVGEEGRSRGQ